MQGAADTLEALRRLPSNRLETLRGNRQGQYSIRINQQWRVCGEGGVPLRQLLDAEIPVALGTNGVPYSMLWTMWEALVRWDGDAQRRLGASQLSREEALRMAVQSGHLLTWSKDRRGSIEVGKDADLTMRDGNPLTSPEDGLKDLAINLTIVGGRIVYDSRDDTLEC